ncbi:winged helix DNA-binding domain-containing protein [Corallococcus aberystwythensis]|uniref:Winged helix DNA-binding domain-containing protein n=1 Tax=Corallococcus aberystwythensis TaxID=2316722 RepID=A0A3A8Q698_9BACT|nr:winged helix DNA-binding domain-containing protein [Corallococcus aberystwythensis]RKH62480.1 winged helix DNA-binding domain-containing protein [Corallococcus aberystwythensis]
MPSDILSQQALNRALLARQLLLTREKMTVPRAIEHLVGLQAQLARPPYLALWSRLQGFQRDSLTKLALKRELARGTMMRGTLHLMTAKDYLRYRGLFQPLLAAALRSVLKERATALDLPALLATAKPFLEEQPRTFEEVRAHLLKHHVGGDERAMGFATRMMLPLVQVPEEGLEWGWPGNSGFTLAESWLGEKLSTDDDVSPLVLRYLAAFGPATVADMQSWSGIKPLKDTFEKVRGKLVEFRDEKKRVLFDLPKAPRPPEDTPAPVRFLPDFDNLILSHADRTRVVPEEHRPLLSTKNLRVLNVFLVDGRTAGTWTTERKKGAATLVCNAFDPLKKPVRDALVQEGEDLLRFSDPDAAKVAVTFAK